ncbi:MopE-related protein [Pyxidicoccus sp. MSG2]|uniref:MopE-related protein n=1 Tax=Pyxidicoccus sp. MSG2 TaxID=2996790 RepID=UPI002271B3C4|nr:MopE-related protein [Pyxidicoccus sp. MSG2]MCY1015043.1 MopE-related protein [Pyxidicoccus sp. MSG2]
MKWLSLFAVLLTGCLVPSLDEVEAEGPPGTCDAEHPCVTGYFCVEGICQTNAGPSCEPGNTALCDLQKGVCEGKARACIEGHEESVCTAASYGMDYEPAETLCDNKDNDCDGATDEALTLACAKQQGVCEGSVQACTEGTYPACDDAVYLANNGAYQPFEQSCDGQDNDCDGQKDAWSPINVSRTTPTDGAPDAVRSRNVAAISVSQGGQSPVLLTLYEEGDRILARTFTPDGRVSQGKAPSATVPQASTVTEPVLASNGLVHVGAWIEELPPGSGTVTHRVMVAPLGIDGVSTIQDRAAVPIFDQGRPLRLALSVSNNRALVVVEQAQESGGPRLWAVTMPLSFPPPGDSIKTQQIGVGATGSRPSVFPPRSATETFFVAYESATGIRVASVRDDATVSPLTGIDVEGASQPQVFSDETSGGVQGYTVCFVPPTRDRISVAHCTGGTCSPQPELVGAPLSGPIQDLRITSRSPTSQEPLLATWVSSGTVQVFLPSVGTEGSLLQANSAGSAFRPVPVVLEAGVSGGGKGLVIFDTEGNTSGGLARDEIFVLPVCLP